MKSLEEILENARGLGACRFVVSQAADEAVLSSMEEARKLGIAEPILYGVRGEISETAKKLG